MAGVFKGDEVIPRGRFYALWENDFVTNQICGAISVSRTISAG